MLGLEMLWKRKRRSKKGMRVEIEEEMMRNL